MSKEKNNIAPVKVNIITNWEFDEDKYALIVPKEFYFLVKNCKGRLEGKTLEIISK